jgi:hypothetical protein
MLSMESLLVHQSNENDYYSLPATAAPMTSQTWIPINAVRPRTCEFPIGTSTAWCCQGVQEKEEDYVMVAAIFTGYHPTGTACSSAAPS